MSTNHSHKTPSSIVKLSAAGLKSIRDRQEIELRPLTILAGPNSSGKSSIMQGLLLLKQTLSATYDPGPLLIRGPNVAFASADQLLFRSPGRQGAGEIEIGLSTIGGVSVDLTFVASGGSSGVPFRLASETIAVEGKKYAIAEDADEEQLFSVASLLDRYLSPSARQAGYKLKIHRNRCFYEILYNPGDGYFYASGMYELSDPLARSIEDTIHLPGLRATPERTYPITAIGDSFPGTFQYYAASVIARWSIESDPRLQRLGDQLAELGLTWKVEHRSVDDTQVELRVGRLPSPKRGGAKDLVNIADVGLGVSQTLPVLVSLLVARPGQIVYIEQPEIHLHPKAQSKLAEALAEAANRGVHAVIETHSSLLLLGVQSLIAEGRLSPEKVKLHWFNRDDSTGATTVRSADLDEAGRFGDWPEDFGDVTLEAESRYLDAAEARIAGKS